MIKPKKHLGQHFLKDPQVIAKIAQMVQLSECKNILEIGPGTGALTKYLTQMDKHLKVIEIDREAIGFLRKEYPKLEIIEGDFLKEDLNSIFNGEPFALIGNFPYNISSQIIFKMLENTKLIPEMVGMFQLEMAQRIEANANSKSYGIISVMTQMYYSCNLSFKIPPHVFVPPPKVYSAMIICKRNQFKWEKEEFLSVKKIVKVAFHQRRKKLLNALKAEIADKSFWMNHPFAELRAENLSSLDFLTLATELKKYRLNENK